MWQAPSGSEACDASVVFNVVDFMCARIAFSQGCPWGCAMRELGRLFIWRGIARAIGSARPPLPVRGLRSAMDF